LTPATDGAKPNVWETGGGPMRTRRFSTAPIVQARRQAEGGTPVGEICRQLNITETTFYRWKKRFLGLDVSEVRELKSVRDETRIASSSSWSRS
jgi:putative transposase